MVLPPYECKLIQIPYTTSLTAPGLLGSLYVYFQRTYIL